MITPSHELKVGQIVTVFSVVSRSNIVKLPELNAPFRYNGDAEFKEVESLEIIEHKPWLGGIPFVILELALPLIMVRSCINQPNIIPPFLFFDTNLVNFIVVPKKYSTTFKREFNKYYQHTGLAVPPSTDSIGKPIVQKNLVDTEKRIQDGVNSFIQQTLKE